MVPLRLIGHLGFGGWFLVLTPAYHSIRRFRVNCWKFALQCPLCLAKLASRLCTPRPRPTQRRRGPGIVRTPGFKLEKAIPGEGPGAIPAGCLHRGLVSGDCGSPASRSGAPGSVLFYNLPPATHAILAPVWRAPRPVYPVCLDLPRVSVRAFSVPYAQRPMVQAGHRDYHARVACCVNNNRF